MTKYDEALVNAYGLRGYGESDPHPSKEFNKFVDTAILALKKQVLATVEIDDAEWRCPSCHEWYDIMYERCNYCPNCGQYVNMGKK